MDGSIPRCLSWSRDADHGNSVCTGAHMPSPMRISCSAPDFHERLLCFFRRTLHAPSAKAFEFFRCVPCVAGTAGRAGPAHAGRGHVGRPAMRGPGHQQQRPCRGRLCRERRLVRRLRVAGAGQCGRPCAPVAGAQLQRGGHHQQRPGGGQLPGRQFGVRGGVLECGHAGHGADTAAADARCAQHAHGIQPGRLCGRRQPERQQHGPPCHVAQQ